jgi:hypothetical protein
LATADSKVSNTSPSRLTTANLNAMLAPFPGAGRLAEFYSEAGELDEAWTTIWMPRRVAV